MPESHGFLQRVWDVRANSKNDTINFSTLCAEGMRKDPLTVAGANYKCLCARCAPGISLRANHGFPPGLWAVIVRNLKAGLDYLSPLCAWGMRKEQSLYGLLGLAPHRKGVCARYAPGTLLPTYKDDSIQYGPGFRGGAPSVRRLLP